MPTDFGGEGMADGVVRGPLSGPSPYNTSLRGRGLLVLAALCACDCGGAESSVSVPAPTPPSVSLGHVPLLAEGAHRGMCVAHSWQRSGSAGYGSEQSAATLDELASLGVDSISLTPFGFVDSITSAQVRGIESVAGGETNARVRAEIRAAHARQMRVVLKPHLWLRGGAWRAELAPDDGWPAFFQSYGRWMLSYAALAQEEGVEVLAIGTELRSSLQETEHWRALIAAVREVYSGELVYCANWDALDRVQFWDGLDFIGVQFYPPIADSEDTSAEQMSVRLDAHLDRLAVLSRRVGRPVLLTEVGYKSTADTAVRPYEWSERASSQVDERAQEQAYRVLFRGLEGRDWLAGVYLWKWFTDPTSTEGGPGGFSPRGKPAEAVVRAVYARERPNTRE